QGGTMARHGCCWRLRPTRTALIWPTRPEHRRRFPAKAPRRRICAMGLVRRHGAVSIERVRLNATDRQNRYWPETHHLITVGATFEDIRAKIYPATGITMRARDGIRGCAKFRQLMSVSETPHSD